jgi:hypothetical protein
MRTPGALRVRGLIATVVVAGGLGVVAMSSEVSAACTTGSIAVVSVTGVVVSTSIVSNDGLVVSVRSDDGSTHTVRFFGRNPSDTLPGGVENTFEDAWSGDLPQEGGRYTLTGAEPSSAGEPIDVNECAPGAAVQLLAAPSTSSATEAAPTTAASDDAGGRSIGATVAVLVGVVLGGGLLVYLLRRRAS